MFCPKCGNALNDGSTVCSICGHTLQTTSVQNKNPAMLIGAIISVIAGAILLLLGYQTENYSNGIDADAAPSFVLLGVILLIAGIALFILSQRKKNK